MTYYGGKELAAAFRIVRNNTLAIAEEIPENKYDFRPAADTRSIGQTLVHIALGPSFQHHVHANKVDDLAKMNWQDLIQKNAADEAKPRTKAETIAFLKSEGDKFEAFLAGLPEPFLSQQVTMPPGAQPPTKSRFEMLLGVKEHEMHHRAQLMTMQRMLGLVPHLTRQRQERMSQMQATAKR